VEKLLLAANSGLALSILVMLGCVAIAYPLAEHFSMAAQIAAHIAMLILPSASRFPTLPGWLR